jgi:hypothetical protein
MATMVRRAPYPTAKNENDNAGRPAENEQPSNEPVEDEPLVRPVSRAQLMSAGRPVMTRPGG